MDLQIKTGHYSKDHTFEPSEIYYGDRREAFKNMIRDVLTRSKLKDTYIDILMSEESMKIYSKAFTDFFADKQDNYEMLEICGDSRMGQAIVWYFFRRFPQLDCSEGVKVIARLKINYGSKKTFYQFGEKLGFWDFISAPHVIRQNKKKPLLEDTFEAFIGATELILDCNLMIGAGGAICYNIAASLFDEIHISLKYEDLYDAKTLLKQLFDHYKDLGKLKYEWDRYERDNRGDIMYEGGEPQQGRISYVVVHRISGNRKTPIGKGSAALKADAEQKESQQAIYFLNKEGYIKKPPAIYSLFCQ